MTDLFKTPEQLFKKYLLSNVFQLAQSNFEPFNEIDQRSETEITQYLLEIGLNPEGNETENQNFEVDLKLTTDIPNRNEELELTVNKGEKEFLKGYLALTDETLGLKIPDLHDKYIAVENRDFKKMAKTFNLPEEYIKIIPDKIPDAMTEEQKEKIEMLSNKYITKMTEQFDENSYIAEKDIQINVNEKQIVADRYSLVMSTKTMYSTITTILKELLEDPEFETLCQDRMTTEELEKLKTSYNDFLEKNPVEEMKDESVKLSVYAADGQTVKSEIKMNENEISAVIENNESESCIILSTITAKSETNDVGLTKVATIKNSYTNNSGELSYEIVTEYNKDDIKTLQDEYDAKYGEYTSAFSTDYSEIYEDSNEKYIIKTTKTNDSTIVGTINMEGEKFKFIEDMLDIKFKCQFGNATVNTLDSKNSIVINDYTMEDYQKLLIDFGTNVAKTSLTKPDSFITTLVTNFLGTDSSSEEEILSNEDSFYFTDSSEDVTTDYNNITFPDDESNDNYLYPTNPNNEEIIKSEIDNSITNALTTCLNNYKEMVEINIDEDLGNHLNVENVQQYCGDRYSLELTDSTTIKCVIEDNGELHTYYALMNIDGAELIVTDVEVLTEEEYLNR